MALSTPTYGAWQCPTLLVLGNRIHTFDRCTSALATALSTLPATICVCQLCALLRTVSFAAMWAAGWWTRRHRMAVSLPIPSLPPPQPMAALHLPWPLSFSPILCPHVFVEAGSVCVLVAFLEARAAGKSLAVLWRQLAALSVYRRRGGVYRRWGLCTAGVGCQTKGGSPASGGCQISKPSTKRASDIEGRSSAGAPCIPRRLAQQAWPGGTSGCGPCYTVRRDAEIRRTARS
eukprot:359504-Chlamydomonas_euryale.AAC.6